MRGRPASAGREKPSPVADATEPLTLPSLPAWASPSPTKGEGTHAILRRETRAEHDRVDAAFSRFDLTAVDGYARFLQAQARAFLSVEAAIAPEQPRADALRADLHALDVTLPQPLPAPQFPTPAHRLGAWYVLEGSRLGGALLARSLPPGSPRAFLTAPGPRWAKCVEVLRNNLYQPCDIADAVQAARAVFALFERAAGDFE